MKIGILVYDNVEELDFIGPYEVFSYVNKIEENKVEVLLVSREKKEVRAFNGLKFHSDKLLSDEVSKELDVLIVPGGRGRLLEMNDPEILEYIKGMYPRLKILASVCTGAFFLAEAGLLKGLEATTHSYAMDELQNYEDVKIKKGRVTKNKNIWLSAGISSGIDLSLEMVEELFGKDMREKVEEGIEYNNK